MIKVNFSVSLKSKNVSCLSPHLSLEEEEESQSDICDVSDEGAANVSEDDNMRNSKAMNSFSNSMNKQKK
ncbi:hypothetical protein COB52_00390 [Candidatus Kaiserbacteria bacterium]|nr:MAG: hypothetical protein COB52_00390 [Candidatus Kaiserbacteria bacterium]